MVQVGSNASTLEAFHGGDMTFVSLRDWMLLCVDKYRVAGLLDAPPQPEEAMEGPPDSEITEGTALRATRPASIYKGIGSWEVLKLVGVGGHVVAAGPPERVRGFSMVPISPKGVVDKGLFTVSTDGAPKYQMMPFGSQACPEGLAIATVEECKAA